MVYKHAVVAAFLSLSFSIYCLALAFEHYRQVYSVHCTLRVYSAFMHSVLKLLLKGEVGVCELNSHGNYIVDHGKNGKIMELCF